VPKGVKKLLGTGTSGGEADRVKRRIGCEAAEEGRGPGKLAKLAQLSAAETSMSLQETLPVPPPLRPEPDARAAPLVGNEAGGRGAEWALAFLC
jgi:hypothetical protein